MPYKQNYIFYIYIFFILLQASQTLKPLSHGDALYYHLVGPKIWKESGWDSMWENLSHYAQAGYFDLLYFIPTYFLDSQLNIQILSQFIHFFFSAFIASILAIHIIQHKILGPLCGISILTISKDSGFFFYAKNDGALAFVSLFSSYFLIEKKYTNHPVIFGILLGLIPGIKINGFFILIPLIALLILHLIKGITTFKQFTLIGLVAVLTTIPQLAKNYIYTKNPLFPGFTSIFPGNLTEPMLDHYGRYYGKAINAEVLINQITDLVAGKSVLILFPLIFIFNKSNTRAINYFLIGITTYLIYLTYNGNLLHPRYYFSSYFLIIISIFLILKTLKLKSTHLVFLLLLVLIDTKIDLSIRNLYQSAIDHIKMDEKEIISKYIPLTNLWNPLQQPKNTEYIISDYISNSYYLPKNIRLHSAKQNLGADFLFSCNDENSLKKLEKYTYALISKPYQNKCYEQILRNGKLISSQDTHRLFQIRP